MRGSAFRSEVAATDERTSYGLTDAEWREAMARLRWKPRPEWRAPPPPEDEIHPALCPALCPRLVNDGPGRVRLEWGVPTAVYGADPSQAEPIIQWMNQQMEAYLQRLVCADAVDEMNEKGDLP